MKKRAVMCCQTVVIRNLRIFIPLVDQHLLPLHLGQCYEIIFKGLHRRSLHWARTGSSLLFFKISRRCEERMAPWESDP
uniref:Uncharacterized protein n=1 Tax=Anguilla anguilla TaxID=7936 RepID=A0A0E9VRH9_ANGAN